MTAYFIIHSLLVAITAFCAGAAWAYNDAIKDFKKFMDGEHD